MWRWCPLNEAQIETLRQTAMPRIVSSGVVLDTRAAEAALQEAVNEWLAREIPLAITHWTTQIAPLAVGGYVPNTAVYELMAQQPWLINNYSSQRTLRTRWMHEGIVTGSQAGMALPEMVSLWVWRFLMPTIRGRRMPSAQGWPVWHWSSPDADPRLVQIRGVDQEMPGQGLLWTPWGGAAMLPGWRVAPSGSARWATEPRDRARWNVWLDDSEVHVSPDLMLDKLVLRMLTQMKYLME